MNKNELAQTLLNKDCDITMNDGKVYSNPTPIDGMNDDSLFLTIMYHGDKESIINVNSISHID